MHKDKPGFLAYIIGALSFFPYLGVIFGIVATVWGLSTKATWGRRLATIGTIGMLCSVLLPMLLFFWFIATHPEEYHRMR